MLIKEAQGLGRSAQFIADGRVPKVSEKQVVCWPGEDKNTKGTEMDLNAGTYLCAF